MPLLELSLTEYNAVEAQKSALKFGSANLPGKSPRGRGVGTGEVRGDYGFCHGRGGMEEDEARLREELRECHWNLGETAGSRRSGQVPERRVLDRRTGAASYS